MADRLHAAVLANITPMTSGDLGLAVYLWHCIQGQAELAALDAVV